MYLNKVFVLGRLTQDPQIRTLPSGQLVASFGLATNRVFTNKNGQKQEETQYHNIVAFGRSAEIVQQYLRQGSLVLIEGRLHTRSWEDKNGTKRSRTEIIVENLQLAPKSLSPSKTKEKEVPSSKTAESVEVKEEEIPIIEEENYSSSTEGEKDEINVEDLPL